jgi:hypothetical protein
VKFVSLLGGNRREDIFVPLSLLARAIPVNAIGVVIHNPTPLSCGWICVLEVCQIRDAVLLAR